MPVMVTMTRSPALQPLTASASVTVLSPLRAVAPSLTQVRFIGAPWKSMRPPQQTMAGHDCGSRPSTGMSRIKAVWPAATGSS